MPQIEVAFDVDANGIMHISAKDKGTNKEQRITIQSSGGLSDAEIEKMVKDAEANAAADEKRKEEIELKNNADSLIYSTEKSLRENGDKIGSEVKTEVESVIAELKTAMESSDVEAMRSGIEKLNQASMKIGEAVYGAAGGGGAQADQSESQESSTAENKDDTVIDAEFKDTSDKDKSDEDKK